MTDWYPLQTDGDPFPADPDRVRGYGEQVSRTGELVGEQVALLRRLADRDSWQTEAADAFRGRSTDLAEQIARVQDRYVEVGGALVAFADQAQTAREAAQRWHDLAVQAQAAVAANPHVEVPSGPGVDGEPARLSEQERAQNLRREDAEAELARYQREFDQEVLAARNAADAAAGAIGAAIQDEATDDDWDRNRDWIMAVVKVLGWVALAIALALVFVGTGGLLGIALIVAGLVVGGTSLALNIGLAAEADGEWTAVVLDAIGLVTFGTGGLATRFAARAFGAAKAAIASTRGIGAYRQLVAARMPVLHAYRVMARSPWSATIRQLGLDGRAAVHADGLAAATAARAAVTATPRYGVAKRLLYGGTEGADVFTRSRSLLTELQVSSSRMTEAMDDLTRAQRLSTAATVANTGDLGVNLAKGVLGTPGDPDGMTQGYLPFAAEVLSRLAR